MSGVKKVSQVLEIKALSDDMSISQLNDALNSVGVYIQDIIIRPLINEKTENEE